MAQIVPAYEELYQSTLRNVQYHRIPLEDKDTQDRMQAIREAGRYLIVAIHDHGDNNRVREQAMAYRHVEEAVQDAIAGLARGREARARD